MARIDNEMLRLHQKFTHSSSSGGKLITENEALELIRRAKALNQSPSSSCYEDSKTGSNSLKKLLKKYNDDFSVESARLISQFTTTGYAPEALPQSGIPSGVTNNDRLVIRFNAGNGGANPNANPAIPASGSANNASATLRPSLTPNSTPNPIPSSVPSSTPRPGSQPNSASVPTPNAIPNSIPNNPSVPSSNRASNNGSPMPSSTANVSAPTAGPGSSTAPAIAPPPSTAIPSSELGTVGRFGTLTVDFTAKKQTSFWHWWPTQERRQPGGDPMNNLYANGGPLEKLDKITGKKSQEYERTHNSRPYGAGDNFAWWGHCDKAAECACIFQAPKKSVTMEAANGEKVIFSPHDIQGLLVKVSPYLIKRTDFKGERYNNSRDDANDPKPELFLKTINEWKDDGLPFCMDIDRLGPVWNYPYDKAKVYESDVSPSGYQPTGLSPNGKVTFYHIEMSGTGFDEKRRTYECYLEKDLSGKVLSQGWIKTSSTHNNPDFLWRSHPIDDMMIKANWQPRNKISNPQVDPQVVYDIYVKSLA